MNLDDRRRRRHALVTPAAGRQGGVVSRRQLYALGLSRAEVRAEIAACRWKRLGSQCVRTADPTPEAAWWQAVLEVGPAAVLDGLSALLVSGLRTITADQIHVAVPQGAWFRRCRGVRVHETRRLRDQDVVRDGIPRTCPAVAAVHAALWARTDREATLVVVASVQQRLVRVSDLADAVALVKRDRRRGLLLALVRDVAEGVESIGERDFAAACRRRGFPRPTRQAMRVLPSGRRFYDAVWGQYDVEVEIDGAQHLDVALAAMDMLKQNASSMQGKVLLRIPALAFRTDPEPFLNQLEAALRAGGWKPS